MDITLEVGDYKLNVRGAVVINHNGKILLHKNTKSDHYALPGGRIEIGESSDQTVKREMVEELGKEIQLTGYVSTVENFFEMKNSKYHEIMFVHSGEFVNEEDKKIVEVLHNVEGKDYLQYEWVEVEKLDNINLQPECMISVLKEHQFPVHKVNNELK